MSNYSEEQTNMLVGAYLDQPTRETVEELAEKLGRSVKSIIGKLSREGVYRREVYVSKTGESPITKVEIVNNIAENLGVESRSLAGLEKSPKAALRNLEKAVAGLQQSIKPDTFTVTLGTENYELDVPKWAMTEDPYGIHLVGNPEITLDIPDHKLDRSGWDLENDPEYAAEVLKVTLEGRDD